MLQLLVRVQRCSGSLVLAQCAADCLCSLNKTVHSRVNRKHWYEFSQSSELDQGKWSSFLSASPSLVWWWRAGSRRHAVQAGGDWYDYRHTQSISADDSGSSRADPTPPITFSTHRQTVPPPYPPPRQTGKWQKLVIAGRNTSPASNTLQLS